MGVINGTCCCFLPVLLQEDPETGGLELWLDPLLAPILPVLQAHPHIEVGEAIIITATIIRPGRQAGSSRR